MKNCAQCSADFLIAEQDQGFYHKIKVPEPTLCPPCRAQRRLAWRNERKLYKSRSALSGKEIVSVISPDKPFKVYETEEWWSDAHDPLQYGREFDFERPFFEQFGELLRDVPHMNIVGSDNENCGYCHLSANNKNCYLTSESSNNEGCYFGYWLQQCTNCCDSCYSHASQLLYETDNSYSCYNLKWSSDCIDCADGYFLKDCIGCNNCFGCSNLRHKSYCIFNEQKTKAEYEEFLQKVDFDSHRELQKWQHKSTEFALRFPRKYAHISGSEDCSGDYIVDCKECVECFHAHDAEDCKFGEHVFRNAHHIMDGSTVGRDAEWVYEAINTGISVNNIKFGIQNWGSADMEYCYACFFSRNCFGCVGLKRHKYCILNKEYSKADFEQLQAKIIEHLKQNDEYGEFFPVNLSPFGYNETVAHEQFSLTKEECERRGFPWSDYEAPAPEVSKTIPAERLPDNNRDIPDDVLNWAIECEVSSKPFRLLKQELEFYRKNQIPVPRKHPDVRHAERIAKRNPNRLWERKCHKCGASIKTAYAPERPEIVYCEECYQKEIY